LSMVKTQKKPFDFTDLYCKDTVRTVVWMVDRMVNQAWLLGAKTAPYMAPCTQFLPVHTQLKGSLDLISFAHKSHGFQPPCATRSLGLPSPCVMGSVRWSRNLAKIWLCSMISCCENGALCPVLITIRSICSLFIW
jgi:hypothetical protein